MGKLSSARLWTIALGLWCALCLMPIKRVVVVVWTIDVVDELGAPFPDIRVLRDWSDPTFLMKGADELRTDDKGRVVFPGRVSWRPLGVWAFQLGAAAVTNARDLGGWSSTKARSQA